MLPVRDHLPTRSAPVVNYALIAINVVVMGAELWTGVAEGWAPVPWERLLGPRARRG